MKNNFILGLKVFTVGVLFILIGFTFNGKKLFDLNEVRMEKNIELDNNFETIDLNSEFIINKSNTNKIHIKYYENEKQYYDLNIINDNILSINFIENLKWYERINIVNLTNYSNYTPELYLPDNFDVSLNINSVNGKVSLDDVVFKNLKVNNTNGSIKLKNIVGNDITIQGKNGSIKFEEVNVNDLNIQGKNGNIVIEAVNGNHIKVESINSNVTINDGYVKGKTEISTINGNVSFNNLDFDEHLQVDTTNGNIKGKLSLTEDDYNFFLKTVNGSAKINDNKFNYTNNNNGIKSVKLTSSNGSININTN